MADERGAGRRRRASSRRTAWWSRCGAASELAEDSGVEDNGGWGGITLAYNTRSPAEVDAVIEEARAAGAMPITREPGETFWGGYSAMFCDPDGHPWEVAHNPHWEIGDDGGGHHLMPNEILSDAINAVCRGEELPEDAAAGVLREVMEGRASPEETAGLLIALRTRGETADEIAGLARTMRELATKVDVGIDGLVDTAGTGGGTPTFNVSTTAAFVAAGAGCPVAKHGNRSATSQCGSADVLEALGARIDLDAGAGRRLHRERRLRLHVRAPAPRRDEARRPRPQGAGRAHDLQPARPAHEPGRRAEPGDRRFRRTVSRTHGDGAG